MQRYKGPWLQSGGREGAARRGLCGWEEPCSQAFPKKVGEKEDESREQCVKKGLSHSGDGSSPGHLQHLRTTEILYEAIWGLFNRSSTNLKE